jgi:hypothetical protein
MASNAGAMVSPQFSVASSSSSPAYASSSGRRGGGGSSSVEEHQRSSSSHVAAAAASSSLRSASSSSLAAAAPKKASPSDVIFGSSAAARTVEELGLQADASVSAGSSQQTSPEQGSSSASHSGPATVLTDAAGALPAAREALKEPGVREVEIEEKRELPANFEDADVDDVVLLVGEWARRVISSASCLAGMCSCCPVPRGSAAAAALVDGTALRTASIRFAFALADALPAADMLTRLTSHNDHLPLHPSALTRFHSRATPGITITSYLRRIARYTSLDKACALILLVYIDRVCERMEGFTVCSLTVHRFTCAAVVCASKALCDAFSTNGERASTCIAASSC